MRKCVGLFFSLSFVLIVCSCSNDLIKEQKDGLELADSYKLSIQEAQKLVLDFVNMDSQTKNGSSLDFSGCKMHYCQVKSTSSITKSGSNSNESIPVYELLLKKDEKDGFALVVGDKRVQQVLAYSEDGSLNDTTFNLGLKSFVRSIPAHIDAKLEEYMNYSVETNCNLNTKAEDPSKDMYTHYLPLNVSWGQNSPYNNMIPYSCSNNDASYGGKAPAGCAAVAVAQLMSYYKSLPTYNWNLLLTSSKITQTDSEERKNEVARLMYNVGQDLFINYSCDGSGASSDMIKSVLTNYGYTVNQIRLLTDGPKEIRADRPMLVIGYCNAGGHAWLIDGLRYHTSLHPLGQYRQYQYYSMNWGWNGSSDGQYLVFDVVYGSTSGTMNPIQPTGRPSNYEFNRDIKVYSVSR